MKLEGKITDYGDLLHVEQWFVKGQRLHYRWKVGPVVNSAPEDRVVQEDHFLSVTLDTNTSIERVDLLMDLMADQKVTLTGEVTDEVGNPVSGSTVTYTVDNADIVNLTDNGDGTAVAAATGTLGTATVHAEVQSGAKTLTADLLIAVVAGEAERFTITTGTPEEVTPDEQPGGGTGDGGTGPGDGTGTGTGDGVTPTL